MEILDAALNQPLESNVPTMTGIFDSAALVSPENTDPSRVRSEQFFDPKLSVVDQVVSQETVKPVETQPVVTNIDFGPIIDAISKEQTSPNVQATVESPTTNQSVGGSLLSTSISDSLANISTSTNTNEESTRLATEYSNEIVNNYKLSQQRNEATINSLVNLDNYLKDVSSSTTQNQQQSVVNDLQTGITNVLAQRNETNSTENNTATVDNSFSSQVSNLTDGSSRVENNSLISPSQINKLVKPQNPVVSSIENLSQEFTRNMTEMNSSLTSSLNNQSSNTTINDSTVNQFDQSSTVNQLSEQRSMRETGEEKKEGQKDNADLYEALSQNSMYLASIYELLQSGIKVKISY